MRGHKGVRAEQGGLTCACGLDMCACSHSQVANAQNTVDHRVRSSLGSSLVTRASQVQSSNRATYWTEGSYGCHATSKHVTLSCRLYLNLLAHCEVVLHPSQTDPCASLSKEAQWRGSRKPIQLVAKHCGWRKLPCLCHQRVRHASHARALPSMGFQGCLCVV